MKEKTPPWPLDVDVDVRLPRWKYARRGQIRPGDYGYCFYYREKKRSREETYQQIGLHDPPDVTVVGTGVLWTPYETDPMPDLIKNEQ